MSSSSVWPACFIQEIIWCRVDIKDIQVHENTTLYCDIYWVILSRSWQFNHSICRWGWNIIFAPQLLQPLRVERPALWGTRALHCLVIHAASATWLPSRGASWASALATIKLPQSEGCDVFGVCAHQNSTFEVDWQGKLLFISTYILVTSSGTVELLLI